MATRKSITKAKTKTTKRTTKSAAARTSKTTTKSKAVAQKPKNVKTIRRNVLTVSNLHALSVVLFIGLAIAAGFLMQSAAYTLTTTHLTNDVFLSQDQTVFIPVSRALVDLDIRWVLVGLLVFSAILPVLYLTRLKAFYAARLTQGRVLGLRWIETAISSALMVEVIALLTGINDIMTLKLMGGLVGITAALSWLAEKQNEGARQPVWSAYIIGLFTGALPWVAIATTMLYTILFGAVRSPWFVYALAASVLAGFILPALNLRSSFRNGKSYELVERNYVLTNLLVKGAFAAILIVGLSK